MWNGRIKSERRMFINFKPRKLIRGVMFQYSFYALEQKVTLTILLAASLMKNILPLDIPAQKILFKHFHGFP